MRDLRGAVQQQKNRLFLLHNLENIFLSSLNIMYSTIVRYVTRNLNGCHKSAPPMTLAHTYILICYCNSIGLTCVCLSSAQFAMSKPSSL